MNSIIEQLAERRAALVARIASQRIALAEEFSPVRESLTLVDKGLHALRYLAKHPVVLAGVMALVAAIRPKRWLFVLENGWMAWHLFQTARHKLEDKTAHLNKIEI